MNLIHISGMLKGKAIRQAFEAFEMALDYLYFYYVIFQIFYFILIR